MSDLELPWITSKWSVLVLFIISLVVWHLLLLYWLPLTKSGWKKVDYYWVSLALLGAIGSVAANRRELATNFSKTAQSRVESAQRQVKESIAFGHSPAICRKFVRSEFSSPPAEFDRRQREFDEMCAWFRSADARLMTTPFAKGEVISIEDLGSPLPTGADQWAISRLRDSINWYNEAVAKAMEVSAARQPSTVEELLTFLGPSLLAIAVALRLTKVTGELRLEKVGA